MYGGIYRGVVSGGSDPQSNGRVQILIPSLPSGAASWAMTSLPPDCRGGYRTGQFVWVMFENGDVNSPVVVGLLGSGS